MTTQKTAYVYSHTHWDREWYLTQRQFQSILARTIDELLEVLESRPDFANFVADGQTILFHDYCELRPENRERFLRLAKAGRLDLGPWYTMPDLWLPCGESIIRNLLAGYMDCKTLGLNHPNVGYVPDSFGHIEQMPQIMNGFAIDNYIFGRGDSIDGLGKIQEFEWVGPDKKSKVIAHRLIPYGYGSAAYLDRRDKEKLRRHVASLLLQYETNSSKPWLALLGNGIDHMWVQKDLPEALIDLRELFPDWLFLQSTLMGYLDAFRLSAEGVLPLKVYSGCLHGRHMSQNMLHGTWSSRIDLKLANARTEAALLGQGEPLSVLSSFCGGIDMSAEINLAWRLLMANHAHDSICGCSMDDVHADNLRRFGHATELAEMAAKTSLDDLCAHDGVIRKDPVLATFAGLGGASGCVEFLVDCPCGIDAADHHLVGPSGDVHPIQVLSTRNLVRSDVIYDAGEWKHGAGTELKFTEVRAVSKLPSAPPCSLTKYHIVRGGIISATGDIARLTPNGMGILENTHLRVELTEYGTLEILHKSTGLTYKRLLVISSETDLGGGYTFRPLAGDKRRHSDEMRGKVIIDEIGPVRGAISINLDGNWPLGISLKLLLEADSSTIECLMVVDNKGTDHRARLLLPLPFEQKILDVERAFTVTREDMTVYSSDDGQDSHPMRNWVAVTAPDGRGGLAFIGRGLHEFALADQTLEITLLRCVQFVHDCGTWETPAAQMQGKTAYKFALAFFDGSWRESDVAGIAHRFVHPSTAQVYGSVEADWSDVLHASVRLVEAMDEGKSRYISTFRSTWQTVFNHRDGWRRDDSLKRRVPEVPSHICPVTIDAKGVLVSAFKLAEVQSGTERHCEKDAIVRLYSIASERTLVNISLGHPFTRQTQVWLTDLAERPISMLSAASGIISVEIEPNEIVTLRLSNPSIS